MPVPIPTSVYRLVHIDNLSVYLERGGLHAPNHQPQDGLEYHTIHNSEIQDVRHVRTLDCGPGGCMHDYVPFYFGPLSPMLLQLKTGQVCGYNEGQGPLIYIVSTAQAIEDYGLGFVFSNGHGIAAFTDWYGNLDDLKEVDWQTVYKRYWSDTAEDPDRQRRKQAEFLIYQYCPWDVIDVIGVVSDSIKQQVENILDEYGVEIEVSRKPEWYY